MKRIDPPKAGFVPFSLTVETEEEARLLAALVGACNPSVTRSLGITDGVSMSVYQLVKEFHPGKPISITTYQ